MKSSTTSPAAASKFYLQKHRNKKYYVVISRYNSDTKKNNVSYRSLKTNNKQQALINFNRFISDYNNNTTEIVLNKNITFEEFYAEIINQLKASLSKNTISIYNLSVRKFIEIVGNKMLRLININDIEQFKVKRLQQDVSKFQVNKELSTLKAVLNIAIKLNYLVKNPVRYVKKFAITETKIKVFTDDEIELLLSNINNPLLLNIVKFALYSGLRLNEILNLQVSDIDYQNETINISCKSGFVTKDKKNKVCILNQKLITLLNEILKLGNNKSNVYDIASTPPKDRYLFTVLSRNYPICKDYVSHKFKSELRRLHFSEDLHFHSLRHTYISNLVNKGIPINFVKEIIGHSSIATTMKYITLNKNELVKYANQV